MQRIGVVTNTEKDADFSYTEKVLGWIKERGGEPVPFDGNAGEFYGSCHMAVVLGGDGTILRAAREAAKYDVPILGINLGGLGYLTDADKDDGENAVARAMSGRYRLEKRMMLALDGKFPVLNDVFVYRGGAGRMISVEIYINGDYMDTFRGDGLIVSTPTGSTAYNLSAGGPILKPDSEMICITGICPHSLTQRPWVISGDDVVGIRLKGGADASAREAGVIVDGEDRTVVTRDGFISIARAKEHATIMRTTGQNFYEILRRKMGRDL